MDLEGTKKNAAKFICEKCNFKCSNKYDYELHLSRPKHKRKQMETEETQKNATFICKCLKKYKSKSGLWKHIKNGNCNKPKTDSNELLIAFMKQNQEFQKDLYLDMQKQMFEFMKNNMGNNNNNNNTITNNNNNKFNLNFFLNETCKDAMNISEFINSLQVQLSDLENVGKLGYVDGISNIIVNKIKSLEVNKRPIHCSDIKRETLYVKDENKWEKEDDENLKLKNVIKHVSHKNIKMIPIWKQQNPDCTDSNSVNNDIYNKIIIESMCSSKEEITSNENKIIKKMAKEVVIDKKE